MMDIVTKGSFTFRKNKDGFMELQSYDGSDEVVTVPDRVDGCPVCVKKCVFDSRHAMRQLIFEKDVRIESDLWTELENTGSFWPFIHCMELRSLTLPDDIDRMTEDFFPSLAGCPALREVTFRRSSKNYIAGNGFVCKRTADGCTVVYCLIHEEEITVPETVCGEPVTAVDMRSFADCHGLKRLNISEGVRKLHDKLSADADTMPLPLCGSPEDLLRLAREEVGAMTDEEREELTDRCITLIDGDLRFTRIF